MIFDSTFHLFTINFLRFRNLDFKNFDFVLLVYFAIERNIDSALSKNLGILNACIDGNSVLLELFFWYDPFNIYFPSEFIGFVYTAFSKKCRQIEAFGNGKKDSERVPFPLRVLLLLRYRVTWRAVLTISAAKLAATPSDGLNSNRFGQTFCNGFYRRGSDLPLGVVDWFV